MIDLTTFDQGLEAEQVAKQKRIVKCLIRSVCSMVAQRLYWMLALRVPTQTARSAWLKNAPISPSGVKITWAPDLMKKHWEITQLTTSSARCVVHMYNTGINR
jgi:hypothetical protein